MSHVCSNRYELVKLRTGYHRAKFQSLGCYLLSNKHPSTNRFSVRSDTCQLSPVSARKSHEKQAVHDFVHVLTATQSVNLIG